MPYLAIRSGSYYLRLAVPKSLQPLLGQAEIFQNLQTSQRDEARVLALSLTAELLLKFAKWKSALKNKNTDDEVESLGRIFTGPDGTKFVVPLPTSTPIPAINARDFNLGLMPNGQPYIAYSDPSNPKDFENAQIALKQAQEAAKIPAAPLPQSVLSMPPAALPVATQAPAPTPADEVAGVFEKLHGIKPKNIHSAFNAFVQDLATNKVVSARHYQGGVKHFIDWITQQHPNIQVHKIRKDHLKEYRELLAVTKSRVAPYEILHPHNIYKRMGFVERFFRFCQDEEWMPAGDQKLPTWKQKGPRPDYDESETSYEAFTQPELVKLFSAKNYQPLYKAPHLFWAPLLGLFQGARRGEIANIHPDAINNANKGIWTMSFTRLLKNKNSKRSIPLHSKLIELGFLEYMEDMRKIFPAATSLFPYSWNIGKYIGEGFAEHCDSVDISDPRKVFHSFRSNVAQTLLHAGVVEQKYREHFTGHLKYSLHESVYSGKENPMGFYANLINTHLVYDLNLDHLKYRRGMFDEKLLMEKMAQDRKAKFGNRKKRKVSTPE